MASAGNVRGRLLACLLLLGPTAAARAESAAEPVLDFVRDGEVVARLDLASLRAGCTAQRVRVDDPYYGRGKEFYACPLAGVLARGFGEPPAAEANLFLRARDGYSKPTSGAQLAEPGAWIAFADAEVTSGPDAEPRWEPIDRRQVDPGPLYLVWSGPGQGDAHRYPWPYQLATIEIAPFESEYPHTVPSGVPAEASAWRGFGIFRRECIACHAVNGEGGVVGPELNVPRSIVEYRPAEQIKAYVRDPQSFRYTSMPSHPHLSDADLAGLVDYFKAMMERKHDPRTAR